MIRNVIQRSISTAIRLPRPQGPEISTLEQLKNTTPEKQLNDPTAELFSENCLECEAEMKQDIEAAYKRIHAECAGIDEILDDTWFLQWHERRKYEDLSEKTRSYFSALDAQLCKYQRNQKKFNV
uniref:Uncharacterized protein n=1 Tax=Acrobeloides nanus TaxID=290746 RepID=A0A914EKA4_9BILA